MKIHDCYTDGSALGNPGPGGWAWVSVCDGEKIDSCAGGVLHATNNQMELQAVIECLQSFLPDDWQYVAEEGEGLFAGDPVVPVHVQSIEIPIRITTDSSYVQQGVTEWMETWVRRGWRRSKGGKLVANVEQRKQIHAMLPWFISLERVWTRAHVGTKRNEWADDAARGEAEGVNENLPKAKKYYAV